MEDKFSKRLSETFTNREIEILKKRCQGQTLQVIGDELNISKERVRQIIEKIERKLKKELGKTEREKITVIRFFRNKGEEINKEDLIKLEDDDDIDILYKDKKFQVRFLDEELIGKTFSGRLFLGDRNFKIVKEIIKKEIKEKENKYSLQSAEDIILLLDGFLLFSLLEMSGEDRKIARYICSDNWFIERKKKTKFKNIFIVGYKFNIPIK